MASGARPARIIAALSAALLIGYLAIWTQVSPLQVGRSDFTSTYVGATLLRTGERAHLYDASVQYELHAQLIAPDREGNLPFVDAPAAAALAAPVTLLDLQTAYRLWSLLQLFVLGLAITIAVRSAPWPRGTPVVLKLAAGGIAIAGAGTLVEVMQAQWGSVAALGLALAYRDWRNGNDARGAALLVISAGIAKPHLAFGLFAFMIGWRQRRVIAGAAVGAVAVALASVAVAGPSGVAQFVQLAITSNTHWELRSFSGFVGIPGSVLGNSGVAQMIGVSGSLLALAAAFWLGAAVRRRRALLDVSLAGSAALSVLAAPHAGTHDLVLLAPAAAWSVAAAMSQRRALLTVVGLWTALTLAAFISLGDSAAFPPGQLAPWVLIAAAVIAVRAVRVPSGSEHRLTSQRDGTALGALAHGIPGPGSAERGMLPLQRRSG